MLFIWGSVFDLLENCDVLFVLFKYRGMISVYDNIKYFLKVIIDLYD